MTTAYVGSSSRHLQRVYNMNAAGPGDSRTERERRMIPSLGAINMTDSLGSASYHGLQATLDKRLSHGWQGSLSYTWSHSIDNVLELAGGEGNVVIQDWRNLRGDRGNSGFDRRHRLVANAAVDLPFGAGRRWLQQGGLWASCSATGSCRRSSRRSQGPTSTSRCSTPRTASESRSAAACGGPIWWVIQPCRIRRLTRG